MSEQTEHKASEQKQQREEARIMKKTSKEDIQKQTGKYDDDGFYILEEGDFYDPNGYYFDKKGFDASGGSYDEDGNYIPGNLEAGFTRHERLLCITKEEIEKLHPDGHYDDDDFYILKDGDFYDPFGYYFNKNGFAANGGHYDDDGYYIEGKTRSDLLKNYSKELIEKEIGNYDEDGFYLLPNGSFYDPLGYFFDEQGFDEVGGYYDDEGFYVDPDEEYNEDSDLSDEEDENFNHYNVDQDGQDENDALDREFDLHEHIIPAQLRVKQELSKDKNKHFCIIVANFPKIYEEVHILRFFNKQIPNLKHSKMLPEYKKNKKSRLFQGNVLIQTNDLQTIDALLLLHGQKLKG